MKVPLDTPTQQRLSELLGQLINRIGQDPEGVHLLQQVALTILEAYPLENTPVEERPGEDQLLGVAQPVVSEAELDSFIESFARAPLTNKPDIISEPEPYEAIALAALPNRLELKARACRWLAEHGYTHDPSALAARIELIVEAKETRCYLWMLDPESINPASSNAFRELAEAFGVSAQGATLLQAAGRPERSLLEPLALLQTVLRERVNRVRPPAGHYQLFDEDQKRLHQELKRLAQEHHIFLRGLGLSDTLPAHAFELVCEQLTGLEQGGHAKAERSKAEKSALSQIAYHRKLLLSGSRRAEHDWNKIAEAVKGLTESGMPESDVRIRRALEPLAAKLPEDTPHAQLVAILGEAAKVERERAARAAARERRVKDTQPPEVQEVAELIGSRTLVVIGGSPNERAAAQLEEAFGCTVNWLTSKPHDPPKLFEPHIAKHDVILVLLLIRWSSHVFGEADALCDKHGKYLVRIQAGYNARKVASEIQGQVGERLKKQPR